MGIGAQKMELTSFQAYREIQPPCDLISPLGRY